MTAIDHSQGQARVVHELTDRIIPTQTYQPAWVTLEDFLALAATLQDAGYSTGQEIERIGAINDAVNATITGDSTRWFADIDLMTADPADVAERVRQAGIDRTAQLEMSNQRTALAARLAKDAGAHLRADSDRIVQEMRKRFEPAAKVVQTAAKVGLNEHSDMTLLLDMGSTQVIEAYRNLGPAVAELDRIASLRNQLTSVAGVGPRNHPMAAFLTNVSSEAELEGAAGVWTGQVERVQHNLTNGGTHLANVRRKRLGGAWLALVCAGYKLRLNTGDEAAAVVDGAQ